MEDVKKCVEYAWKSNVNVLIGKKLYECRVNHTQYTNGEFDGINVTLLANGKTKNVKFSEIYKDTETFKDGKPLEPHIVEPTAVECNGKTGLILS